MGFRLRYLLRCFLKNVHHSLGGCSGSRKFLSSRPDYLSGLRESIENISRDIDFVINEFHELIKVCFKLRLKMYIYFFSFFFLRNISNGTSLTIQVINRDSPLRSISDQTIERFEISFIPIRPFTTNFSISSLIELTRAIH